MLKRLASVPLLYIVLFSFILKAGMFCYMGSWNKQVESTKIVVSDSKGYEAMAENIVNYHSFTAPQDTIDINRFSEYRMTGFLFWYSDALRLPVYPAFLALVYEVAGIKPFVAIFMQILLSLISVVFVYRITMLLFENKGIASLASLLFAADIHSAFVANQLLTDTLFVVFMLASVYWFIKGLSNAGIKDMCISAVFMGIACLTRPVVLLYPLVFIFILFVFQKQAFAQKMKTVFTYILIFFCLTGLWAFRNHAKYGSWQLTTQGGYSLLMYNATLTRTRLTHENADSVRVSFQRQANSLGFKTEKNPFKQSAIYEKVAMRYIMQHKGKYLLTHLQGGANMFFSLGNKGMGRAFGWNNARTEDSFAEASVQRVYQNFASSKKEAALGVLILFILAIQYIGCLYGIVKFYQAGNYLLVTLLILTALYFALVTGVIGMYRYKLPVVPFICMAAAYGYYYFMQGKKS